MINQLPLPGRGAHWAFFLDVDGTLADIAPTPSAVVIVDHARDTLSRLVAACNGAVALISGRAIADVDRLFAPLRLPVAGLHGLERRDANGHESRAALEAPVLGAARAAFENFAADHPGALIEDKDIALALHFRQAPAAEADAEALAAALIAASKGALVLQRGKKVVELRPGGSDKGTALRAFMTEPPFAGRLPVFVGDDVTDEAGFAIINEVNGISIRVGDGTPTCARYDGASVAAIHGWLEAAASALCACPGDSRGGDSGPGGSGEDA
jgi:trehalose 6-phosphate phosphatase